MTQNISQGSFPELGFGLGLRPPHYPHIFEHRPHVDWFEIISENYMDTDGRPKRNLERILEHYPVVMHGVALSIGTVDPLNSEYLQKLKTLMDWVKPAWISDHLCWTGIAHRNTHDLLPVPYTEEALAHIIDRIKRVQDYLGRPIALENPSTYLEFKSSYIPEAEFITRMAEGAGCNLLLDVNNIYVNCYNHRLDPKAYIDALPLDRVIQVHLAGHDNQGTHIIDTHDNYVNDDVWSLYRYVVNKAGRTPNTMIEWDDNIPAFDVLYAELNKARVAAATAADTGPLPDFMQAHPAFIQNEPALIAEQQARMQNSILSGSDDAADTWIRSKEDFPPNAQLSVYINAYRYRLYNVVAEDYPVLKHYLGDDRFDALLWSFIDHQTSDHFNVARYAAKLPQYIQAFFADDGFAGELCALETALAQVTDAPESTALQQDAISTLTGDDILNATFLPRKAHALFEFRYPVNDYYQAVMDDQNPIAPAPQNSWLYVFRHDDVMWRVTMDHDEFTFFSHLIDGNSVGQTIATLNTGVEQNLSHWFSRWMHQHFLHAIHIKTTEKGSSHAAA